MPDLTDGDSESSGDQLTGKKRKARNDPFGETKISKKKNVANKRKETNCKFVQRQCGKERCTNG